MKHDHNDCVLTNYAASVAAGNILAVKTRIFSNLREKFNPEDRARIEDFERIFGYKILVLSICEMQDGQMNSIIVSPFFRKNVAERLPSLFKPGDISLRNRDGFMCTGKISAEMLDTLSEKETTEALRNKAAISR